MAKRKPDRRATGQPVAVPSSATRTYFADKSWLLALALMLVTFVAYAPVWRAGFIWDDKELLIGNRMVKTSDGLYRIWFTTEAPDYYPLTWSLWWLEWRAWGASAVGYHAVNLLLHSVNVVLLWLVLRRLQIPGAWLAGLVFAIHPVNVATVGWVSEQKNTLSMLFYLLAILLYLRFDEEGSSRLYGLSLGAFLLALLSKSAVVMLPVALLGCVWWQRGGVRRNDLLRSLPFFALSLVLGLVTMWFHYEHVLRESPVPTKGIISRLLAAGWVPWFYLCKALLPINLTMIYPQWHIDASRWISYMPGMILVGCFALFWWRRKAWGRPVLFGFGYFVVTLFPVLGFFDQSFYRFSLVADHWQYYSIVGVIALTVAAGLTICRRIGKRGQFVGVLASAAFLVALGAATWARARVYANSQTLWQDNTAKNPNAWAAHYNLGNDLAERGKAPEAIEHYEQALRINPDYAEAHNNLGSALVQVGKLEEAIAHCEQALRLRPGFAEAYYNFGVALERAGRVPEAMGQYEQVLRLKPGFAGAHNNLGIVLVRLGRVQEAIGHYEQALRLKSDDALAQNNLGGALLQLGRSQEAIGHFEQALRLKPDYAEAHYNLGVALMRAGRLEEAIGHYEQALRIRPDFAQAQSGLARLQAGR